jgi:predicted ATPase
LFRRLAVFANGCTVEAAAEVGGCTPDNVLDRLGSLVDKSLLVAVEGPGAEPRFRLLETVREYALEQLRASGEEATARDAHAGYVLAFVEHAVARLWIDQHDRALVEHDHVRAALRWLLDQGDVDAAGRLIWWLGRFWWRRGLVDDARTWASRFWTPLANTFGWRGRARRPSPSSAVSSEVTSSALTPW